MKELCFLCTINNGPQVCKAGLTSNKLEIEINMNVTYSALYGRSSYNVPLRKNKTFQKNNKLHNSF